MMVSTALLALPLVALLALPEPAPSAVPARPVRAAVPEVRAGEAPDEPGPVEPAPVQSAPVRAPEEPSAGEPVRGVVLDPEGEPAGSATVSCKDREASATTDEEGRFELPPEADGCTAVATRLGMQPSEPTRLSAGRENAVRLTSGGSIEGSVVDEQGRPVERYLLAVESFVSSVDPKARFGNRSRSITDPGGAFRWEKLPPGRYVLAASAEGRPPTRSDGIEVEAGRATHHVRIVLAQGASLSGRVIDAETRAPIADASVQLDAMTSSGANAIRPASTDAAGSFAIEGVPARGPFSVRVQHPGYVSRIVPGLDARGTASLRADIELRPRGDGGAEEELTGIGATLMPSPEGVTIVGLIEGGPAERGGLARGDRVVRIDGADATGMSLSDCVQRLRGAPGTRVSVAVDRDGQSIEMTLQREVVRR